MNTKLAVSLAVMLSEFLAGELKMVPTTGWLLTPGIPTGEITVSSRSNEALTSAGLSQTSELAWRNLNNKLA